MTCFCKNFMSSKTSKLCRNNNLLWKWWHGPTVTTLQDIWTVLVLKVWPVIETRLRPRTEMTIVGLLVQGVPEGGLQLAWVRHLWPLLPPALEHSLHPGGAPQRCQASGIPFLCLSDPDSDLNISASFFRFFFCRVHICRLEIVG